MFDTYEKALVLQQEDPSLLSASLWETLLSYLAWAGMRDIPDHELKDKRAAFFEENLPGSGDALMRLLHVEDEKMREDGLRFLLLSPEIFETIRHCKMPEQVNSKKAEQMRKALESPLLQSQLIGIQVKDSPLFIHISTVVPDQIKMHYSQNTGVFLCVGEAIDLASYGTFTEEDLLKAFKALGEASRLTIFKTLLREGCTTSQLADAVGLTLSTVNHHLKQLIEARLVNLELHSRDGKGAVYCVNQAVAEALLEHFSTILSFGNVQSRKG